MGLESARLLARKAFLPSGQDLAVGVWPGAQRGKCTAEDKVQLCSWDVGVDISYIDEHFISIQVLAQSPGWELVLAGPGRAAAWGEAPGAKGPWQSGVMTNPGALDGSSVRGESQVRPELWQQM